MNTDAKKDLEKQVIEITARLLRVDSKEVKPSHHLTMDLGAESIQKVELMTTLEGELGVELNEDRVADVEQVSDMIQLVSESYR
ncbi:MAG: acyl carrier protein [Planctomycetia bacterium]|jgi:acyl carrier protein